MSGDATLVERDLDVNGVRLHVTEAGAGPLVLLLHGFPELGHSYRHQLVALAEAGYHAVAPDQRGYGASHAPTDPGQYTQLHLAGDAIGLVEALGASEAVVVGHDWGSPLAANTGLFRPDLVRGVVLLSVPYTPRGSTDVLSGLESLLGPHNYQSYFQTDAAQRELEADPRQTMLATLVGLSGDRVGPTDGLSSAKDGWLPLMGPVPDELPPWLTDADLDHYASEFARTGFLGALNWYRTSRTNWELLAPWHHAPLLPPTLFVGGDRDPVLAWPAMQQWATDGMRTVVPNLTRAEILEGCGHWTQQERPDAVNDLLLEFLAGLPASS